MDLVVGPWGVRAAEPEAPPATDEPRADHPVACENCGAVLRYAPGTEQLSCTYCGHTTRIDTRLEVVEEQDLDDALARVGDVPPPSEPVETQCTGCGAGISFDGPLHAGPCPFCGQSVVCEPVGPIAPTALLPFLIGEEHARERIDGWLKRLWFAPNHVAAKARGRDALRGCYVPYFTFDSKTETAFQGLRGDVYYETRYVSVVVNGRRTRQPQQVPKIRWRPVRGRVARAFDDVLVAATRTLPRALVDRLRRFDTHEARPFQAEFLTGFASERYQISLGEAFDLGRAEMQRIIEGDVRAHIGGDMQKISALDVRHRDRGFKLALVPVWHARLRFMNRVYHVLVNGRTGEVVGERPYSFWKIAIAVLGGLLVLGVIFALATDAARIPPVPYRY